MSSSAPNPADTEEHLNMLRRLATLGMRLAEETVERAVNSPYHPEAHHEPCQSFARVSRAVGLTIVLQARFEAGPLAFRNGGRKAGTASGPRPVAARAPGDADDARLDALDPTGESLCEREDYDEFRGLTFDQGATAVRADFDRSAVVGAASCEVADGTSALRGAPSPRPPAPSYGRGHWFQQAWPDPPKPPDTG
jgi:hypothetical protein